MDDRLHEYALAILDTNRLSRALTRAQFRLRSLPALSQEELDIVYKYVGEVEKAAHAEGVYS